MAERPRVEGGAVWQAEGRRVALVTCADCGAALLVDPANTVDVFERHNDFHNRLGGLITNDSARPVSD